MDVLRAAPFSLSKGTKIIARAKANNIKGFNDTFSSEDPDQFTLVIETEPDAPPAPYKGADTRFNVLHTYWDKFTDFTVESGGVKSAILSYHLQRNQGNNTDPDILTDTWTDLIGLTSPSLIDDF
jgi:hypothetical protein